MHLCAQVCFQRGERDGPDSPGGKASIQQTPPCAISAHLLLFPAGGKNRSTEFEIRPGLHLGAKLVPILSSVGGRMLPVAGSGLPCRNPLLGNSPGPKTQ